MANTQLKVSIFDSGIDFESTTATTVKTVMPQIKELKVTAALSSTGFTKVALAFGMYQMLIDNGSTQIDNFTHHYFLNNRNEHGSIACGKNPYSGTGIDGYSSSTSTTDDSLIGFWQSKLSSPNVDDAFYRVFVKNLSGGTIRGSYTAVRTIDVDTPWYPGDADSTWMAIYNTNGGNEADTGEKALAVNLYKTFYQYQTEANEPTFIPLEQLPFINDPANNFFSKLGEAYGLMKFSGSDIVAGPYGARLFVIMANVSEKGSVTLPMGTVKAVAVY